MNKKVIEFNLSQRKKSMPELRAGDIVRVHRKIKEGEKERVQVFEGMVIAIRGRQSSSPMITVRKVSNGVGVELVIPIYSPVVEKIELVKRAKIRKAKLGYIRNKSAKSLRLKYKDMAEFAGVEEEETVSEEAEEEAGENSASDKSEYKSEDKSVAKKDDSANEEAKEEESKKEPSAKEVEEQ